MSTPRREEVERKAAAGAALTAIARKVTELRAAIDEHGPQLQNRDRVFAWEAGAVFALEKQLAPLEEDWAGVGEMYARAAAADFRRRAADASLRALDVVDENNEVRFLNVIWQYAGEGATLSELPEPLAKGATRRVYAVADPCCVAVELLTSEGPAWVQRREVP